MNVEDISQNDEDSLAPTLAVVKGLVLHHAVQIGAELHALALAEPAPTFAVIVRNGDRDTILSLHEDESTAVARCKRIVAHLEEAREGEAQAEGRGALQ